MNRRIATLAAVALGALSLAACGQKEGSADKAGEAGVLNLYTDIQNVYNFKTHGAPVYTNLDANGAVIPDANGDTSKQGLRTLDSFAGNILPTIGIIIKI